MSFSEPCRKHALSLCLSLMAKQTGKMCFFSPELCAAICAENLEIRSLDKNFARDRFVKTNSSQMTCCNNSSDCAFSSFIAFIVFSFLVWFTISGTNGFGKEIANAQVCNHPKPEGGSKRFPSQRAL